MTRSEKQLPPIPPKPSGKRGRLTKSNAHNLWEPLRDYEVAVLLFAKNAHTYCRILAIYRRLTKDTIL
jgi:transposase